jgi:hypothetical protein
MGQGEGEGQSASSYQFKSCHSKLMFPGLGVTEEKNTVHTGQDTGADRCNSTNLQQTNTAFGLWSE